MYYLNNVGLLCTLGSNKASILATLLDKTASPDPGQLLGRKGVCRVGEITEQIPSLPMEFSEFSCRNNRLAAAALEQIRDDVDFAADRFGRCRVAVVMATSTSGVDETGRAIKQLRGGNDYPTQYHAHQGMLGGLSGFVSRYLNLGGPSYTLSTACSSSANAALSARRLLASNLCDAVVFGGVDSLCDLTSHGFAGLEVLSSSLCKPLAADRDGINIGEAAAVFLMSREARGVKFVGGAGSSDSYHISAPHPEGDGAYRSMSNALSDAGLDADEIDYINLHGTGTKQNDSMESKAVYKLFGGEVPCSSTKSVTGHTLGAAGALELGFCWLLLGQTSGWRLPPSLYADDYDSSLPPILLAREAFCGTGQLRYCLTNSFAFGGSNVSLIVGKADD